MALRDDYSRDSHDDYHDFRDFHDAHDFHDDHDFRDYRDAHDVHDVRCYFPSLDCWPILGSYCYCSGYSGDEGYVRGLRSELIVQCPVF